MNGAQALIRSLTASGVDMCFANPGTAEMHFVAQLDAAPGDARVLAPFEGVATRRRRLGRMAGRPACTLLHLGPGLGNGPANLHNARRARTPVVNLVGDHATYHRHYDAPLTSDIESLARNSSAWFRSSASTAALPRDVAEAVAAARSTPRRIATLVLPTDVSWGDRAVPVGPAAPLAAGQVPDEVVTAAASALRSGEPAALPSVGGPCASVASSPPTAPRQRRGRRCWAETFPACWSAAPGSTVSSCSRTSPSSRRCTPGAPAPRRRRLQGTGELLRVPVQPSSLVPDGCEVHILAGDDDDPVVRSRPSPMPSARLMTCAARFVVSPGSTERSTHWRSGRCPAGRGAARGRDRLGRGPDLRCLGHRRDGGAPRHDWLTLTGGSIGQGLPVATGAAVACPDRPVISLEGDGSAMYTLPALWTQAHEGLDVTTVIFSNHSYAILELELPGSASSTRARAQGPARPLASAARLRRPGEGHGRAGDPAGRCRRARGRPAGGARRARTAPDRRRGPSRLTQTRERSRARVVPQPVATLIPSKGANLS